MTDTAFSSTPDSADPLSLLAHTPLYAAHVALGARMVPFAGTAMPLSYTGIIAEHEWTRQSASLFDVSHMGQALVIGPDHERVAAALERMMPAELMALAPGRQRYTQLLNEKGGIRDDLIVHRSADARKDGTLMLVVNAASKADDYAFIAAHLPAGMRLEAAEDRALLALQGPEASAVLARLGASVAAWPFMAAGPGAIAGIDCHLARSGYTGEDGFEISVAAAQAREVWDTLLADPAVKPAGLGARDSLRLEAGLCLAGQDFDESVTPVEAGLTWSIGKRRRSAGGFLGAETILAQLEEGPPRLRAGLKPDGKAPVRAGAEVYDESGKRIGIVTSGGFGPSVGGPIAMGLLARMHAAPGTRLLLAVRGKMQGGAVVPLPFVPARTYRGA